MKKTFYVFSCLALLLGAGFSACNNHNKPDVPLVYTGNKKLLELKNGMSTSEVKDAAGKPDKVDNLGSYEEGGKTHTRLLWHYGDNQNVMFEDDKVISIVLDVQKQEQDAQRIMDSAMKADKLKNEKH